MQYTVNHSETSLIFIEASKIGTLSKAIPKIKGNVRTVVYWGSSSSGDVESVKKEVSMQHRPPPFVTIQSTFAKEELDQGVQSKNCATIILTL